MAIRPRNDGERDIDNYHALCSPVSRAVCSIQFHAHGENRDVRTAPYSLIMIMPSLKAQAFLAQLWLPPLKPCGNGGKNRAGLHSCSGYPAVLICSTDRGLSQAWYCRLDTRLRAPSREV
jgi:hypothetical protein